MGLRTHNLTSGSLRKNFGEVDEVLFEGVESHAFSKL
jgi:hypothetical protein